MYHPKEEEDKVGKDTLTGRGRLRAHLYDCFALKGKPTLAFLMHLLRSSLSSIAKNTSPPLSTSSFSIMSRWGNVVDVPSSSSDDERNSPNLPPSSDEGSESVKDRLSAIEGRLADIVIDIMRVSEDISGLRDEIQGHMSEILEAVNNLHGVIGGRSRRGPPNR